MSAFLPVYLFISFFFSLCLYIYICSSQSKSRSKKYTTHFHVKRQSEFIILLFKSLSITCNSSPGTVVNEWLHVALLLQWHRPRNISSITLVLSDRGRRNKIQELNTRKWIGALSSTIVYFYNKIKPRLVKNTDDIFDAYFSFFLFLLSMKNHKDQRWNKAL